MSDNWIVQNLQNALDTWNEKLREMWSLLTISPTGFKGGAVWDVIQTVFRSLQAVGYSLLVLFFVIGIAGTFTSLEEIRRPEKALKLFLRFALAKAAVTYGMTIMLTLTDIVQGTVSRILSSSGVSSFQDAVLPDEIVSAVENCGFLESVPLWAVTLIGSLFIVVLSFLMILTVYGRFFRIYMYAAIAPLPLATLAGEGTQNVGKQFLKSFAVVLLEGAVIVVSCIIFSVFASEPPQVSAGVSAVTMVWAYIGELCFNMLVLVGAVKMSDRVVREMTGI